LWMRWNNLMNEPCVSEGGTKYAEKQFQQLWLAC